MGKGLEFDSGVSRMIEAGYAIPDVVRRRAEVMRLLEVRSGERALDIGCGPGFLSADLAAAVGPSGRVVGIDASQSMVDLATARCSIYPWVELGAGDAADLPGEEGQFDLAVSVQVHEYVEDVDKALAEIYRVLRPGGRVLILDTDWKSIVWHSTNEERMAKVLDAWDEHLAHPCLPRVLGPTLRNAGFELGRRELFFMFNPEFDMNTFSGFIAGGIAMFVGGRRGVTPDDASAWMQDLTELAQRGEYFFSLNQYIFVAHKPDTG